MDAHQSDKLDLYSVPVFVLELLLLIGLAFAAHHIHFQYKHEPYLTGFYCDDISIRHEFHESKLTEQFEHSDNELVVLSLLLIVPIVVVSRGRRLIALRHKLILELSANANEHPKTHHTKQT